MKGFFGHPPGLSTLFFTEMWERFSYYGGRSMLVLYMTAAVAGLNPGFGLSDMEATAIYAIYVSMVYMTNLPGGWIADKFIGARNSVFYGGCIIAAGNLFLASPFGITGFFIGLTLIAIGTGLLKPNVSTMVGSLYAQGDVKRDSAFSIFYMGINLGAFLAPLIAGYFGENINWRLGFFVVAIGMVLGLIQYKLGAKHLGNAGVFVPPQDIEQHKSQKRSLRTGVIILIGAILLLAVIHFSGLYQLSVISIANIVGILFIIVPIVYFGMLFAKGGFNRDEKRKITAIIIFYLAAAIFWAAFEQAGSTFTLFADRNTDNRVFGQEFPTTWWQSVNAIFIIALSPVFAWLWIKMKKSNKELSTPMKFAVGLFLAGMGFLILVPAASIIASTGAKVGVSWLLLVYLTHTIGELFLSPVGLSAMTKLAPERIVGQMMGVWFLGAATGNYIGGRVGGLIEEYPLKSIFLTVSLACVFCALVMFFLVPWMKRLMGEIK